MKERVVIQDAPKHLFDCEYHKRTAGAESLAVAAVGAGRTACRHPANFRP